MKGGDLAPYELFGPEVIRVALIAVYDRCMVALPA
jgi:hypothetical protein